MTKMIPENEVVRFVYDLHRYISEYGNAAYATKIFNDVLNNERKKGVNSERKRIFNILGLSPMKSESMSEICNKKQLGIKDES